MKAAYNIKNINADNGVVTIGNIVLYQNQTVGIPYISDDVQYALDKNLISIQQLLTFEEIADQLNNFISEQDTFEFLPEGTPSIPEEPEVFPLLVATQWNPVNNANETRSLTGYVSRHAHFIGSGNVTKLRLSFGAWTLGSGSTGLATNLGNNIPIVDCSIQYNGINCPVTFEGSRSTTILDGESDIQCDEIDVFDVFGVEYLEPNDRLDVKLKVLLAQTTHRMPTSPRRADNSSGGQVWFYDPANTTVSSTDGIGVYTSTGTAPQTRTSGYSPVVLGVHTTTVKTLFARGDSITSNIGDGTANQSGTGWFQRLCGLFETPLASINIAVSGASVRAGRDDIRINELYKYTTDGIVFAGTNDFGTSGVSTTVAEVKTRVDYAITQMKDFGLDKIGVGCYLLRTTSSDLWVTEENQTIFSGWGEGGRPHELSQIFKTDDFYDFVIPFDSVRGIDIYKWKVNGVARGFAFDDTHPSSGGHIAMAQEALPIVQNALGIL